ncbi:FAD-dependent oxidoreductase [Propionivibrio sp.]|uniref:FAD-dependent oxidoreductase n=1 Tax=Propionivibrio sp. TaxID=2212460 RepID=UPI002625424B|nr:FAD-dependent oxidoreductase [Propionivibrio sp.]
MIRLVLIGGGHAHVQVLAALARQPFADCEVTLISPFPRQIYSGMLPGWIAGHYSIEQCAIPIVDLARRSGVRFIESACTALDIESKRAHCANGEIVAFDAVSIDSGPIVDLGSVPGILENAIPIRPIEGFVAVWPSMLERARHNNAYTLSIVGDGAAGTELAFAIQERFTIEQLTHARVILIGGSKLALTGLPERLRDAALSLLKQRNIEHLGERPASAFLPGRVRLSDASEIACDASLVVTGAAAPLWPAASGMACDANGFIRVTATLQSISHRFVFAAGDVAAYAEPRPKSGVFAVRAGPLLADNLRAYCTGRTLCRWNSQKNALYLISTGKRHALAAWGPLSIGGDWVWRWKDRIDRRFMQRFT